MLQSKPSRTSAARGGAGPGNRTPRVGCDCRNCPCPTDEEAGSALCSRAVQRHPGQRRLAIILRQHNLGKPNQGRRRPCQAAILCVSFARPMRAPWAVCWSSWPFSRQQLRPTNPAKPSAKPPEFYKVGRWKAITTKSSRSSHEGQRQASEDSHTEADRERHKEAHCA